MDSCWETQAQSPSEAKLQNFAGAEFRPDVREGGDAVEIPPTQVRRRPGPVWCKFSGTSSEEEVLQRPRGSTGDHVEVESDRRLPSGSNAARSKQVLMDSTQLPEVFQELLKCSNANTELMMKAYDDKLRQVSDEVSQLKQAYAELFKSELSVLKCELSAMRRDFETLSADLLLPDMSLERISLSVMRKDLDEVRALALSIGKATTGAAADWDLRTSSSSLLAMDTWPCSAPPPPPPPGAIDFFMEFDRTQGKLGIEVDDSDGTSLVVTAIHEGLLHEWNGLHPEDCIRPGDRVVAVDGCGGDAPFLLEGAQRLGRVKLTVRRYARSEQDRYLATKTNSKDL